METPPWDPKRVCHLPMHDQGAWDNFNMHEHTGYTHLPFLPVSRHTNSVLGRGNTSTGFLTVDLPYTPFTSSYMWLLGLHVPIGGTITTVPDNSAPRANSHEAVSDTLAGITTFVVVLNRVSPRQGDSQEVDTVWKVERCAKNWTQHVDINQQRTVWAGTETSRAG